MSSGLGRPPDYIIEYARDLGLWFITQCKTGETRVVDKSDMFGIRESLLTRLDEARANYPRAIGIWNEQGEQ